MVVDKTVELLESLLSGRLEISEFGQQLSDELFQLRQDVSLTEWKRLLSRIQLYLHEFREGNRDIIEVYMAAQGALDLARPFSRPLSSKTEIETPPSQPGEVIPTSSSLPPDFSKLQPIPV